MQEETQSNPMLAGFLARNARFLNDDFKIVNGEKVWELNRKASGDPEKVKEIKKDALDFGVPFSLFPTPRISIPSFLENSNDATKLLFLHESDIEDGGPQPRSQIQPNDPDTVALFESIKPVDPNNHHNIFGVNQREAIATYPSPLNNGKHRICEGHRRRLVILNMLRLDGIWALEKKRTEQEAFEDAAILNNKKNLSILDRARHYKLMMEKFPLAYPTLDALGKKVGATKQDISLIFLAAKELEIQKPRLDPGIVNQVDKLPERNIRELRKAPEEVKPSLYEGVITNDLDAGETKELIENTACDPTPEKVAEEAKRIAEERAEAHMKSADKEMAKVERARDKVVAAGEEYPEAVMKAVYGYLGIKGKVTPEKAKVLAFDLFGVWFERSSKEGKLDADLMEADAWK